MAAQLPSMAWKRALENDVDSTEKEKSQKRQKVTNGPNQSESVSRLMAQLENGLNYVQSMTGISDDAKHHAKELRKILHKDAFQSMTKEVLDTSPSQRDSRHTDVPPPFPGVKVPGFKGGVGGSKSSKHAVIPPLPPITDLTLLNAPFTHTSTLPHYLTPTSTNTYEPLEFLGDAYLEVIATRLIHNRFPSHTVGQKAGLREILIKNETLAQYSREYGLGERVKVSGTERELGGKMWTKVLADVFEAYVACIIMSDEEHGFLIAEDWLQALWEPKLEDWRKNGDGRSTGVEEHVSLDVKSELQRYLISKGAKLEYLEEKPMELDKAHNRTTFFMAVYLSGWGYDKVKLGSGSSRSKQLAGAEAAKNAFTTSKAILDDAHRKKIEFDKVNSKKKGSMPPAHSGAARLG